MNEFGLIVRLTDTMTDDLSWVFSRINNDIKKKGTTFQQEEATRKLIKEDVEQKY